MNHVLPITTLRTATAFFLLAALAACLPTPAFAAEGQVNLNSASAEELALLPRVGPAIAGRIVEFRDDNGPFETLEDLMLVRGIGERTFELIEPYAALEGDTTLTEKVRSTRSADSGGDDAPTETPSS